MSQSIKGVLTCIILNRTGHWLLVLSLCFVLLTLRPLARGQPQFVSCVPKGEEIYGITMVLVTQPLWVVAIGALHFPAMLITGAATSFLGAIFSLSCVPMARLETGIFFVANSVQWMFVGYAVERLMKRRRLHSQGAPNKRLQLTPR